MKSLGKKEIFSVALGSVIGWGAFVLPGNVFLKNHGLLNTAIGFAVAIFMLAFIEKSYAAVMERVPKAGGEYSFANELLGKKSAFITGWGLLLAYISIIPLNATAVPMVLDKVFPAYSQGILLYNIAGFDVFLNDVIVSLSIIIFFIFINLRGIRDAALAQTICVFSLVASLVIIIAFTFTNVGDVQYQNLNSNVGALNFSSIIRIIAFAPWAFIGFDTVAQLAADHNMPAKKISKLTLFAIILGALIYNGLNLITALGIHANEINSVSWQTGVAVKRLVGDGIFYFLAVAMFGAVVSGLNGFFIGSSRLVLSMSRDYHIGKHVEQTSSSALVIPKWIILFVGACSLIVPFFGRNALFWFVDLSSVGASVAYLITCICAYKIAKNNNNKVVSVIGIIVSILFLIFLLTPFFGSNIEAPSYFALLFWSIFGVVIYLTANKHVKRTKATVSFGVS